MSLKVILVEYAISSLSIFGSLYLSDYLKPYLPSSIKSNTYVVLALESVIAGVMDVLFSMLLIKSQRGVMPALADFVESSVSYAIAIQLIRPYLRKYIKYHSNKTIQTALRVGVPSLLGGVIYVAMNSLVSAIGSKLMKK